MIFLILSKCSNCLSTLKIFQFLLYFETIYRLPNSEEQRGHFCRHLFFHFLSKYVKHNKIKLFFCAKTTLKKMSPNAMAHSPPGKLPWAWINSFSFGFFTKNAFFRLYCLGILGISFRGHLPSPVTPRRTFCPNWPKLGRGTPPPRRGWQKWQCLSLLDLGGRRRWMNSWRMKDCIWGRANSIQKDSQRNPSKQRKKSQKIHSSIVTKELKLHFLLANIL